MSCPTVVSGSLINCFGNDLGGQVRVDLFIWVTQHHPIYRQQGAGARRDETWARQVWTGRRLKGRDSLGGGKNWRSAGLRQQSFEQRAAPKSGMPPVTAGRTPQTRTRALRGTPRPLLHPLPLASPWPLLNRDHTWIVPQTWLKSSLALHSLNAWIFTATFQGCLDSELDNAHKGPGTISSWHMASSQ